MVHIWLVVRRNTNFTALYYTTKSLLDTLRLLCIGSLYLFNYNSTRKTRSTVHRFWSSLFTIHSRISRILMEELFRVNYPARVIRHKRIRYFGHRSRQYAEYTSSEFNFQWLCNAIISLAALRFHSVLRHPN